MESISHRIQADVQPHKPERFLSSQTTPKSNMQTTRSLPPEIWRLILRSFSSAPDDLVFLWLTCRHVSCHFTREVESIFMTSHLKRLLIDFHMTSQYTSPDVLYTFKWPFNVPQGTYNRPSRGPSETPLSKTKRFRDHDVLTIFDRLSPDHREVFFAPESLWAAKFLGRLAAPSTKPDPLPVAQNTSCLRHSKIPIFTFTSEGEVEFDWRGLLSVLFAEAKSYSQRSQAAVSFLFPSALSFRHMLAYLVCNRTSRLYAKLCCARSSSSTVLGMAP